MKKVLTIILTVLVFLSAATLGVSTVFRVQSVAVEATVVSDGATEEVNQMKGDLEAFYKDRSMFSVKAENAQSIFLEYPYFRLIEFKKTYPNKLLIKIVEDAEVYAVADDEKGYYILGRNGVVLDIRQTIENRLDKGDNVRLTGLNATGEKGGTLSDDELFPSMFTLCKKMDEALDGIRRNVLSVEVLRRAPETTYLACMREGVKIYIDDPMTLTEEKASVAVQKYLELTDSQKMTGRILVVSVEGTASASYSANNEL